MHTINRFLGFLMAPAKTFPVKREMDQMACCLRALGLYSLERRTERGDLTQLFKIVKDLAEIRGQRGVLFHISGERYTKRGRGNCAVARYYRAEGKVVCHTSGEWLE